MGIRGNGMSKGRTFCQKVKKQRVRSLSPRDLSFMRGGGRMAGANGGGEGHYI